MEELLNFTVGPVNSEEAILKIGGQPTPYFRTQEFSDVMLDSERLVKKFAHAPEGARAVFLTASGTGSMETTVMNVLTPADKVIVIDGGSFGHRFVQLCQLHDIPHDVIKMDMGHQITAEMLASYAGKGYTALLVNMHETSTGVLYDMPLLGEFCRANGMLFIVDAISAFLADRFDMTALGADIMITGSQKALACQPGISLIILSPRALQRVEQGTTTCMYFDLKDALRNADRGQTPFTPAVTILLQINERLHRIDAAGGVDSEISRMHALATDFRSRIKQLPLQIVSQSLSNAVTPLHPTNGQSAYDIFLALKDHYGIWICPNGGDLRDYVFRVGHLGHLTLADNERLVSALTEVLK